VHNATIVRKINFSVLQKAGQIQNFPLHVFSGLVGNFGNKTNQNDHKTMTCYLKHWSKTDKFGVLNPWQQWPPQNSVATKD
jgi:hypothetical protein